MIWKLLVDQFNNFVIFELVHCSTVQREKCKIIFNLMPTCEVLANAHQTMKMDLSQVAFLHLKSVLGENVLRDCINAHFVMHICLSLEFLSFDVEMLQSFTLK